MGRAVKFNLITEDDTYQFGNGAVVEFKTNKVNNHIEILDPGGFYGVLHNYHIDFVMSNRNAEINIGMKGGAAFTILSHNCMKAIMKKASDYIK